MNERNEIGRKRLVEAMRLRDISSADLCRKTGLPTSSVSRYVTGHSVPKQNPLGKIAEALNVNPAWLMGYDVPMETEPDLQIEAEKILAMIENLSPENREQLKNYARFLYETQRRSDDADT